MTPSDSSQHEENVHISTFRVPETFDDERLDRVLPGNYSGYTRGFFQRLIRENQVLLNETPCKTAQRVTAGDCITVQWPPEDGVHMQAESIPLNVLYEDADILVINKPSGLIVHPARENETGTLAHALLAYDEEVFRELVDETRRPGIVHRLDRDTTGTMVIAKHETARRQLKTAFAERRVEKTYLLLVQGEFGAKTATIRKPIQRHPTQRRKMTVANDGKPATTHYRVLSTHHNASLVEACIETGRTHQLRVHFAHIYHPVLGDDVYGGKQRDLPVQPPRQMLHAWKLAFPHPATGQTKEFMADIPNDFQQTAELLGFPALNRSAPEIDAPESPFPPSTPQTNRDNA